jgi:hypothetical protein
MSCDRDEIAKQVGEREAEQAAAGDEPVDPIQGNPSQCPQKNASRQDPDRLPGDPVHEHGECGESSDQQGPSERSGRMAEQIRPRVIESQKGSLDEFARESSRRHNVDPCPACEHKGVPEGHVRRKIGAESDRRQRRSRDPCDSV